MLKSFWTFFKENTVLLVILLSVSLSILVKSYFFGFYIGPDSGQYLRAAREILAGNGFYVYPEWFGVNHGWLQSNPGWFGVWPMGYPFLIALTAFVTQAELYLSSKILSILIVWIIGFSLYKRFGRTAWFYALVMLNRGFLNASYYTLSELQFILGLVLFSFWVSDIITEDSVTVSQYVKLTFAALFLFLSRYIGAFSMGVLGLLWIYNVYLLRKHKNAISLKKTKYLRGC